MLLVIFGMTSSKEVIFLRQFYRRILHKYEVPFGDRVLGNGLTHTAQHGQTMYLLPDHRHRFSAALAQAIVDPPSQKLGTGSWVSVAGKNVIYGSESANRHPQYWAFFDLDFSFDVKQQQSPGFSYFMHDLFDDSRHLDIAEIYCKSFCEALTKHSDGLESALRVKKLDVVSQLEFFVSSTSVRVKSNGCKKRGIHIVVRNCFVDNCFMRCVVNAMRKPGAFLHEGLRRYGPEIVSQSDLYLDEAPYKSSCPSLRLAGCWKIDKCGRCTSSSRDDCVCSGGFVTQGAESAYRHDTVLCASVSNARLNLQGPWERKEIDKDAAGSAIWWERVIQLHDIAFVDDGSRPGIPRDLGLGGDFIDEFQSIKKMVLISHLRENGQLDAGLVDLGYAAVHDEVSRNCFKRVDTSSFSGETLSFVNALAQDVCRFSYGAYFQLEQGDYVKHTDYVGEIKFKSRNLVCGLEVCDTGSSGSEVVPENTLTIQLEDGWFWMIGFGRAVSA